MAKGRGDRQRVWGCGIDHQPIINADEEIFEMNNAASAAP